jgi:hypothetical protein
LALSIPDKWSGTDEKKGVCKEPAGFETRLGGSNGWSKRMAVKYVCDKCDSAYRSPEFLTEVVDIDLSHHAVTTTEHA